MTNKATIFDVHGKEKGKIELPKVFSAQVREDIVSKFLEAKKRKQPYSPSPTAGKHYSAMGKIRHRRHVWQTSYGRGMSRVPRKVMSRRGTQFNWVGAEVSGTRGGRRSHPPKVVSMVKVYKLNKKEAKRALESAISATANPKIVSKKYSTLNEKEIKNIPFIVESGIVNLKSKQFIDSIRKILGEKLFEIVSKKKSVRAGRGKMRGRVYKKNAGALLVVGEKENVKMSVVEVANVKNLGVKDLANGGLGRLTIYTENAIKYLEGIYK